MDARQTIPGLSRTESDAATALGAFLLGTLALLSATVLGLHFLSGLPSIITYGILFAVMVFAIVCGVAFVKAEVPVRHQGPPQLQFSNPVRRKKRKPAKRPAAL